MGDQAWCWTRTPQLREHLSRLRGPAHQAPRVSTAHSWLNMAEIEFSEPRVSERSRSRRYETRAQRSGRQPYWRFSTRCSP